MKYNFILNITKGEKMKKIFFIMLSIFLIISCSENGSKTAFENYMNVMKSGDPVKIDKLNFYCVILLNKKINLHFLDFVKTK